jgi:uncharacterized membrane protein
MLVVLLASAYTLLGILRHHHFGSSAYDLGIFDQAVWHMSRFEPPASTVSGFSNILGDHFYPILVLFVPLYWIAPSPDALIAAQAILLAVSMVPVFFFLRDRLPSGVSLTLAAAYGVSWGIQQTAVFDVHEMAFAPLAVAALILAMDRCQWSLFWISACALVLIKEDLIALLSGVGLYLMAFQGERRRGAVLLAASLVLFVVVSRFVIPAFSDTGAYAYTSAYGAVLERPWRIPLLLVTPITKARTIVLYFAPFLFLSLASPLSLLIAPVAVERLLSASPQHWGTIFHYSAPIAPLVAMSAGDGLARILRRVPSWAPRLPLIAAICFLLAAILPGRPPLSRLLTSAYYRSPASEGSAAQALAAIPSTASVVAQAAIAPHLSQRSEIYVLREQPRDADYLIASSALNPWPLPSREALDATIAAQRARGYEPLFERDGWIVLRRAAPATTTEPAALVR